MSSSSKDRAAWVQVAIALVAVLAGLPALWVAVLAYRDQQTVSASQLRVDQLTLLKEERRYATRVAWWITSESLGDLVGNLNKGGRIYVQNRSTVPLTRAMLIVVTTSSSRVMPFPDIPPCSVANWAYSPENNESWRVEKLIFTETSRQWTKTSSELLEGGLEALAPKDRAKILLGRRITEKSGPVAIEFGTVGDCGGDG